MPQTPSIADQYDIGDEELQNIPTVAPVPPAAIAPEAGSVLPASDGAKPTPPRDPVTGQFLPKAPTHPRLLVQTAKDLGLDEAEIESTPTAELRELVRDAVSARQFNHHAQTVENAMSASRGDQFAASQVVTPPSEPPAPSPSPTAGGSPSDLGIDETQYDAGLMSLFKKQAQRIAELEKMVGHQHSYIKNQIEQTTTQKIDGAFEKLGGHFDTLLGKGPRGTFADAAAPEIIRRKAIVSLASQLAGQKANVDQVVAKIGEAAKTLFGLKMPDPPAPKPTAPSLSPEEIAWRQAGLARPTHREGSSEPPGPAKAEKAAAAYLADNGLSGGTEVLDDL